MSQKALATVALSCLFVLPAHADTLISDDLIVDGSHCVGQDCVSGEAFGFDTLRLKENNTRIRFDDTSSSGAFPNTDWELTANDSTNGGRNRFSISDVTNGREIFTVSAGAPDFSLFVTAAGNIGFGTDAAQKALHVVGLNSPSIRLEQDASGGFPAATWDIQANEDGLSIAYNGFLRLRLDNAGNLSLGGSVSASSIPASAVPDYVFRDDYRLMPLDELSKFVTDHRHLPEIPPAEAIARDGLNMTDMQLKLLRKIEELTLYTMQQQAQIDALQARLNDRDAR
ncbi:MAG: hypothetical protein KDH20_00760 [Rhodocyclaceae bacterium]|nr:hypothetical protein [Rhodocyclaceae bacterium]